MHELSVTQSILDIVLEYANNANARKVTDIYLVIGQLSSIVDDSVQFYWDIIAKDTLAEGAILHFKRISAEFECLDCLTRYSPNGENLLCPNCNSTKIKLVRGDEFHLEAIDIEEHIDTQ